MKHRMTKQRQLILETVQSRCDHPTADLIYLDVRAKDEHISRGTVYRNLSILAENGEINHIKVPSADRYDFRLDLHYHIICTECGAVCDAPIEYHSELDRLADNMEGYQIMRHRAYFEGICPDCRKNS